MSDKPVVAGTAAPIANDLDATAIEQAGVTAAKRRDLQAAVAAAEARYAKAQAALDLARQDQGRTVIRAAIDGTIGSLQARVGELYSRGHG